MIEKTTEELSPGARDERERCLAVLEKHQQDLKAIGIFYTLWTSIHNGDDPRNQPGE